MKTLAPLLAVAALVAACSGPTPGANTADADVAVNGVEEVMPSEGNVAAGAADTGATEPTKAAATQADYLGRWVGVEGTYVTVTAKPGGGVSLDNQWNLDNRGTFDGSVTTEGLRFTRGGATEIAVRTTGDATGLKWLAGKADCLTVKPGEGYCRP